MGYSPVSHSPVPHMKTGPLLWSIRERYCNIAAIGQKAILPFSTMIVTPLQNWSVFDEEILTVMRVGTVVRVDSDIPGR